MTFTSILCPIDFSPQSRKALDYGIALSRRFGSPLTAMFVNDPLLLTAVDAAYKGRKRFIERTREELRRFVERSLRSTRGAPLPIALAVAVGTPADEILAEARRRRSGLIVIGTQGLSGLQRLFFGSTTEQVLRRATVPVWAVPPVGSRRASLAVTTIARVVAPIDLAGEWESDVERAADLARQFDAELVLVHVLARVQTPPWLRRPTAVERSRVDRAERALDRVRKVLGPDVQSKTIVLIGNPAHELARLTRRGRSVLAMSLRGTAGVWRARRGSIAYHVLTHAYVPVLALPRRQIGGRFSIRLRKAVNDFLTARDRVEMAGIDALLSAGSARKPSEL